MHQKQNQEIIRASDVWVSELGGHEMIVFTEDQIWTRNFHDVLSVGRHYCPQFTEENFED